jgi:hypothetical protein
MSDPPLLPTEEDLIKRGPVDRRLEALNQTFAHGLSSIVRANAVNIVTVLLLAMVVGFYSIKAATTARQIKTLQKAQAESSATGRATQLQVAALVELIAAQTSPTATAHQQEMVSGYLASLTDAQKTLNADQLRKRGQLAEALGAPRATVNRILNEPVPVITFGPPAPASSPRGPPVLTPKASNSAAPPSPTPTPSRSPALNLQVQCPVICPSH